jgi:hypothetical protein
MSYEIIKPMNQYDVDLTEDIEEPPKKKSMTELSQFMFSAGFLGLVILLFLVLTVGFFWYAVNQTAGISVAVIFIVYALVHLEKRTHDRAQARHMSEFSSMALAFFRHMGPGLRTHYEEAAKSLGHADRQAVRYNVNSALAEKEREERVRARQEGRQPTAYNYPSGWEGLGDE